MLLAALLTPICRRTFPGVVSRRQTVSTPFILLAEIVSGGDWDLAELFAFGYVVTSLFAKRTGRRLRSEDRQGQI